MTGSPQDISNRYRSFADKEAHGKSSLYEALARHIAADSDLIRFLSSLPYEKQQPNLFFAAFQYLNGTPENYASFRNQVLNDTVRLRALMLSRTTQTNEPGRCAVLLPILAQLPQPLAIIEVGAAAGLCLLPDFYAYDYDGVVLYPEKVVPSPPVLNCTVTGNGPQPTQMPDIIWRAGLDLNPLEVSNAEEAMWLRALVWPGQERRLESLQAAIEIAKTVQPRIVRGDLLSDALTDLCEEAPSAATLVIFHTAVLAYLNDQLERDRFAATVSSLCHFWVSNEAPSVFPKVSPPGNNSGRFLLCVNNRPVAWTDPHGASMEWLVSEI